MKRAVIAVADAGSEAAWNGVRWVVLVGKGRPVSRGASLPLLLRGATAIRHPAWSFHPTHAAALAYALAEVGLTTKETKQ